MSTQTYIVQYKSIAVKVDRPSLEELYHDFILQAYEQTREDPLTIQLPSGLVIEYANYPFHACFDHGRISEEFLLNMCIIKSAQLN